MKKYIAIILAILLAGIVFMILLPDPQPATRETVSSAERTLPVAGNPVISPLVSPVHVSGVLKTPALTPLPNSITPTPHPLASPTPTPSITPMPTPICYEVIKQLHPLVTEIQCQPL